MAKTTTKRRAATEKLKRELTPGPAADKPAVTFLSTGSTLLNHAISGNRRGGFPVGHFSWLVGDSTSGKTFLGLTCFAEAARDKRFDDYELIFDQPEKGALMDIAHFFGRRVAARLTSPWPDGRSSQTVEDLYDWIDDRGKANQPFIGVVDSLDALYSEGEDKKFDEQKLARQRGRAVVGSMGDGKAKKNSSGLRRAIQVLQKTQSILIIISQTRDNIGFGAQFNPKTYSGGRALKFYAAVEIWSSVRGKIKQTVNGKQRTIGITCEVSTKKNRVTGRDRTVRFPIYHSVGIDDVGACVEYLVDEGRWKQSKDSGKITAPDFDFSGSKNKLIALVESDGLEGELQRLVQTTWADVEQKCRVERKRRYD